jgi:hypothetical protein
MDTRAAELKLSKIPASKGTITFIDPEKTEYNTNEIVELITYNFGYTPLPHGKTVSKAECKGYKNLKQTIMRHLAGKELPTSTPRNTLYSKSSVYKLLNHDMFDYLMKKANLFGEYQKSINKATQEAQKNLTANTNPIFMQSQEDILLWNIKLKILMDYLEKNFIEIDENLLKEDIHTFIESEGLPIESLKDDEYLSINRLLGHIDEYYSVRERKKGTNIFNK